MAWQRIIKENNRQLFYLNDGRQFFAPIFIGEDRYELCDIFSDSGGFGIIYFAKDHRLKGREVLIKSRRYDNEPGLFSYQKDKNRETRIKKIRNKILLEAEYLQQFKKDGESRMPILNDVEFDFSPSIYGPHTDIYGDEYIINEPYVNEEPYIVMQMIKGVSLWDMVKDGIEPLCKKKKYKCYYEWEQDVLEYTKELTTIFLSFHEPKEDKNGNFYYYIYQDLKPENIILSQGRFLTLLDFGGMLKIQTTYADSQKVHNLAGGLYGVGTFGFQAPEARNPLTYKDIDQRCDIYTLGATMFQLLTGFAMTDILETEDSEIPLKKALEGICSEATYTVMEKCLQRDRNERYSSMKEVREHILKYCFQEVKQKIREYK